MSAIQYSPVPIEKIRAGSPLPVDVFVLINKKYICFRYAGDDISSQRLNSFFALRHSTLYVMAEHFDSFMNWVVEQKEKLVAASVAIVGKENEDIVNMHLATEEKIFQVFLDEELDEEKVTVLQNQTESFVAAMKKRKGLIELFTNMLSFNSSIAHHSTNVAALSVFLGMSCGHSHPLILENLYFAGLFHDYGKIKIHPTVLENPSSSQYKSAMLTHPENSVKYVKSIAENFSIQDSVVTIIEQHHEWFNGLGYPKGLKGKSIYELARVFSIANAFDTRMAQEETKNAKTYARVIKQFIFDKGKEFDPVIVTRCMEALVLAFSGEKIATARENIQIKTGEIDILKIAEEANDEDLLALAHALNEDFESAGEKSQEAVGAAEEGEEEMSEKDLDRMLEQA